MTVAREEGGCLHGPFIFWKAFRYFTSIGTVYVFYHIQGDDVAVDASVLFTLLGHRAHTVYAVQ